MIEQIIEYTGQPAPQDIDFVTQKINEETLEYGEALPFAFFIRDNKTQIIAGANGIILYGKIYTDQLWVQTDYRRQGLARKLMGQVHYLGRKNRCTMATITTMSFQEAIPFYQKLGYKIEFERHGYVRNSYSAFMKKDL